MSCGIPNDEWSKRGGLGGRELGTEAEREVCSVMGAMDTGIPVCVKEKVCVEGNGGGSDDEWSPIEGGGFWSGERSSCGSSLRAF